jgi:predicted SAM-dependent methyltransferase
MTEAYRPMQGYFYRDGMGSHLFENKRILFELKECIKQCHHFLRIWIVFMLNCPKVQFVLKTSCTNECRNVGTFEDNLNKNREKLSRVRINEKSQGQIVIVYSLEVIVFGHKV